MFSLTESPIQENMLKRQIKAHEAGGFVSFEGWIRDHNEDKPVHQLHYDAYPELAIATGNRILREVQDQFDIVRCRCVHRVGTLDIGDMAVWIGVSAAHRDAAFQACRYLIDTIKVEVPIWKHERYCAHRSSWLATHATSSTHKSQPQAQEIIRWV